MTILENGYKVMSWEDFLTQAHLDLDRSFLLHERHDYGFAAYCSQQALEKALKGYLLKHKILRIEPHELGHMSMNRLLREIRKASEDVLLRFGRKNNRFQMSTSSARAKLQSLEATLSTLQTNEMKDNKKIKPKQELWCHSLGLPVNADFEKYLNSVKSSVIESVKPVANNFILYYQTELRQMLNKVSRESKQRAIEKYKSDHGHFSDDVGKLIEEKTPALENLNFIQLTIAILEYIEHLLMYELKKKPELREFFKLAKEIFMLMYPFKFLDLILLTYPHEDLGRYPTTIDGKSSLQIYPENESRVLEIILEVKASSEKIENAIFRRWDIA